MILGGGEQAVRDEVGSVFVLLNLKWNRITHGFVFFPSICDAVTRESGREDLNLRPHGPEPCPRRLVGKVTRFPIIIRPGALTDFEPCALTDLFFSNQI